MENDPNEQKNLAYEPRYKEKLQEMKDLLRGYLAKVPGTFGELKRK